MQAAAVSSRTAWARVIALSLAVFIFNTTEFMPVGLLSDIGASFAMSAPQTGVMITIYAWIVSLASLPCMLATRNFERRGLLLALFALFILSHALSACAWSFGALMVSRAGIALAHAVFWSITVSLAVRVAPEGRQATALSMLSTGSVLAMVAGVPLGRLVGQWVGWRFTFGLIALVALLTALVLARLLPRLPAVRTGSLESVPVLARRPALVGLFVLTLLAVTAHFTAYSYIEPFVEHVAGLAPQFATLLLLILGGAGILGSFVFSRWGGRHAAPLLVGAIATISVVMLLLRPLAGGQAAMVLLCLLWGMGIMVIGLAMQARVLALAPDATDVAMSIFSGTYNVGIGGGALLGSQVAAGLGMDAVGFAGALIGGCALAWSVRLLQADLRWRRYAASLRGRLAILRA